MNTMILQSLDNSLGMSVLKLRKRLEKLTYLAAVMAGTFIWVIRKTGKSVAEMLDIYCKEILDNFNLSRNQQIDALNTAMENEKKLDDMLLCRIDIAEILKENNVMSIELDYRNRLHHVKNEVKKRLYYHDITIITTSIITITITITTTSITTSIITITTAVPSPSPQPASPPALSPSLLLYHHHHHNQHHHQHYHHHYCCTITITTTIITTSIITITTAVPSPSPQPSSPAYHHHHHYYCTITTTITTTSIITITITTAVPSPSPQPSSPPALSPSLLLYHHHHHNQHYHHHHHYCCTITITNKTSASIVYLRLYINKN
ncbi:hypothetical protein QZH41_008894 [Actinostola sp. cb2023]|nr:hypothetical protein QZH41_008894 [Actinostola sp. cb2023]